MPGVRVRVFFGRRRLVATVVRLDATCEVDEVLEILEVLDEECRTPPELLELCRWVADRCGASWGETLDAALPPAVRHGRRGRRVSWVELAGTMTDAIQCRQMVAELDAKFPKQARTLRHLAEAGGSVRELDLRRRAQVSVAPVHSLVHKGLVLRQQRTADTSDVLAAAKKTPAAEIPQLTAEQSAAVSTLRNALDRQLYQGVLLFGVTGSGKTEVYLQALQAAVAQGRQGIALVPEISLTPQTVARFHARFPRIAVLHSALSEAQRREQWLRIRAGQVDVVVGARSAVFAPMPDLGLVVIDEEHEPSFKQQNPPRYHARDVAQERARRSGAVLILGSATPSLESWRASQGENPELTLLQLPKRVGGGQLPTTFLVDLGQLPFQRRPRLLTDRLRRELLETIQRQEQAILFLNRRGFARLALCSACKESIACDECDVSLVLHQQIRRLLCHLCGHERDPPVRCPACGERALRYIGFGTERLEEEVRDLRPSLRLARMDSDTTSVRGSHERILNQFAAGGTDVLLGTQMIAKGLDFPRVTLVGIISADSSLLIPDYRSSERTFQLVAQVAGRAGRSHRPGTVIVQTLHPSHPAIVAAARHNYLEFVSSEMPQREAAGYPPFSRLVRILVSHPEEERTRQAADRVAEKLAPLCEEWGASILGPAPCPIARVRQRFRVQLLIKCPQPRALRQVVFAARDRVVRSQPVRVTLDVDPVSML
jgi:primosomal protein N' (replication factor Y)